MHTKPTEGIVVEVLEPIDLLDIRTNGNEHVRIEPGTYQLQEIQNPFELPLDWWVLKDRRAIGMSVASWRTRKIKILQ